MHSDDPPLFETDTFTVLFGPDGAVRIELTADGRTFARLALDARTADDLAKSLRGRRETYAREHRPSREPKPGAH